MYRDIFFTYYIKFFKFLAKYYSVEFIFVIFAILGIILINYLFKYALYYTSSSYRRSIFRKQAIKEINYEKKMREESMINELINKKERQHMLY